MSRVFWDTNLFIYLFEDHAELGERVRQLRERMNERGDTLLTSAVTLGELQVKPLETGDTATAALYRRTIPQAAEIISFGPEAAVVFAELRSGPRLKAPDAIQLACAATGRTDLFITNDARLSRIALNGVQFVTSLKDSPI